MNTHRKTTFRLSQTAALVSLSLLAYSASGHATEIEGNGPNPFEIPGWRVAPGIVPTPSALAKPLAGLPVKEVFDSVEAHLRPAGYRTVLAGPERRLKAVLNAEGANVRSFLYGGFKGELYQVIAGHRNYLKNASGQWTLNFENSTPDVLVGFKVDPFGNLHYRNQTENTDVVYTVDDAVIITSRQIEDWTMAYRSSGKILHDRDGRIRSIVASQGKFVRFEIEYDDRGMKRIFTPGTSTSLELAADGTWTHTVNGQRQATSFRDVRIDSAGNLAYTYGDRSFVWLTDGVLIDKTLTAIRETSGVR